MKAFDSIRKALWGWLDFVGEAMIAVGVQNER